MEDIRSGKWKCERTWESLNLYPSRVVFPMMITGREQKTENLISLDNTQCKAYLSNENLVTVEPERLLPQGNNFYFLLISAQIFNTSFLGY